MEPTNVGIVDKIIVADSLELEQKKEVESLLKEYADIFASNPKKPKRVNTLQHQIITDESQPVFNKPRKIPNAWQTEVEKQIGEMAENDIIRPSSSPWNSPILLVKKKDGSTRFVCDFRGLNDITKKDRYPLPNISDMLDKMQGAQFWSKLDAASAYWSVNLKEEDKEKTSFSVRNGKWEFNVMPFGFCNAGATYQRLMDLSLAGLPNSRVLAYMDDVVIFSYTFAEHMKSLREVFDRFREAGITLKPSKCRIAFEEVDFLGFVLSRDGIKPQKDLTNAIRDFTRPNNVKELKRFLGIVGFYRQFIPEFAKTSKPLTKLTSSNVKFEWDEPAENAFKQLKEKLMMEPVLKFPNFNKSFIVEADASDFAVGGLSQEQDGGSAHPIAYYSNKGKQKWSTHSKEAYALVLATRQWYTYLMGKPFLLRSDHNPLVYLRRQKDPWEKFARWIAELEEFEYQIEYVPGKLNDKADALSRLSKQREENISDTKFEEYIYSLNTESEQFNSQLRDEQEKDMVIKSLLERIQNNEEINISRYKRLGKQLRIENGLLTKSSRPIVPPKLRYFIVDTFHSTAHLSTEKMYGIISKRYYWPNMYKYLQKHVAMCVTCQKCKADTKSPKAPLTPMPIPDAPMQFVSMDIATLPCDSEGFKYLIDG